MPFLFPVIYYPTIFGGSGIATVPNPYFQDLFISGALEYGDGSPTFSRAGSVLTQQYDGIYTSIPADELRRVGLRRTGADIYSTTDLSANPLYQEVTTSAGIDITSPRIHAHVVRNTPYVVGDRAMPDTFSWLVINGSDLIMECTSITTGTTGASALDVTGKVHGDTIVDGGVTWTLYNHTWKGAALAIGYTNLIIESYDLSKWTQGVPGTGVLDEIGLTGAANTASTVTDDSASAYETVYADVTVTADTTSVVQLYIKKDTDTTRFPFFRSSLSGGTAKYFDTWLNTQTGAVSAVGTDSGNASISVHLISLGGIDYWVLTMAHTDTGTNTTRRTTIYSAGGTVFGTASTAATGAIVIPYAALHDDILLIAVQHSPPIPTAGVPVSTATESGATSYAATNISDPAGTILIDGIPTQDASVLIGSDVLLATTGTGATDIFQRTATDYKASDGTNTAILATPDYLAGEPQRMCITWESGLIRITVNKTHVATIPAYDLSMAGTTAVSLFNTMIAGWRVMRHVIDDSALSAADAATHTTIDN